METACSEATVIAPPASTPRFGFGGADECVRPYTKSIYADPEYGGMVGLRCVFHRPIVLVHGASAGASVAREGALAVSRAGAGVVDDVGGNRRGHWPLAKCRVLLDRLELDSRRILVCYRNLPLFPLGSTLQLGAARRLARSAGQP